MENQYWTDEQFNAELLARSINQDLDIEDNSRECKITLQDAMDFLEHPNVNPDQKELLKVFIAQAKDLSLDEVKKGKIDGFSL
jgi:hypothetical protein